MDPVQIAWAAGLFEGEGTISIDSIRPSGPQYILAIEMTDLDVLNKFRSAIDSANPVGKPRLRRDNGNCKPIYKWRTKRRSEIVRILGLFLPFFGERRAHKAQQTLKEINSQQ